ncbi:MAG: hypothetical protein KGI28_02285 [Thaumarchaeota archaeon]|nr:hypothetical protein [Nitrososphaerota archaeon]
MHWQCVSCDNKSAKLDDIKFDSCKQNNHKIMKMLSPSEARSIIKNTTRESPSKLIYEFIKTRIKKLIVSDNDSSQVFALVENNHNEILDLSNGKAKDWIRYMYYEETGENHSDDAYKNVISLLRSQAIHSGTIHEPIYNRIAMVGDTIYYDLVTTDWKFVKITKESVEIVNYNKNMPTFVRKQQQKEQVKPLSDERDALDELVKLLRIQEKDRQIFKVHLVSMFLEAYPVPLMTILGEHGSIKTTIAKSVKRIIDPSGENISSLPTKIEDLILHLANRYLANFDNVSSINDEISDILCKAITGEGQSKRKLYTDADEIILNYRRKLIVNGIFPYLDRTDLRDRMIRYETLPIKDSERMSEGEFNKHMTEILPYVMNQIFQSIQKTLSSYDHVKNEIKHHSRMADFTDYGECISRTLNYTPFSFVESYKQKIENDILDIVESYPIIQLIEIIMKERTRYEKTVSEFYREINSLAAIEEIDVDSKKRIRFPSSANKVKSHIERIKPNLRSLGFEVDIQPYQKRDGRYPRGSHTIIISRPTLDI